MFLFSDDIALGTSVNLKCYSVIVHWECDLPLSSILTLLDCAINVSVDVWPFPSVCNL